MLELVVPAEFSYFIFYNHERHETHERKRKRCNCPRQLEPLLMKKRLACLLEELDIHFLVVVLFFTIFGIGFFIDKGKLLSVGGLAFFAICFDVLALAMMSLVTWPWLRGIRVLFCYIIANMTAGFILSFVCYLMMYLIWSLLRDIVT